MLDTYGFGGILADDMGLGKTLQTISFLTSRLSEDSKVLILAPSSLIYNWLEECNRFAPNFMWLLFMVPENNVKRLLQIESKF